MDIAEKLRDALLNHDIDPAAWAAARDGQGDFADFVLAAAVAKALGFESHAGWTRAEFDEALSVAVERWPADSSVPF